MKGDNRWIYGGGIAILVALVIVGLLWDRGGAESGRDAGASQGAAGDGGDADGTHDGGADGAEGASDEGDAASSDAGRGGETSGGSEAGSGGEQAEGEGDDIGDVPSDPAECRAYCERLAERGALASGATAADCVERLCPDQPAAGAEGESDESTGAEAPLTEANEREAEELPTDCEAQCRLFHERGELRPGVTVEQCIAAMCSSTSEGEGEAE